ncbi:MAG: 16S rRNA (guanine(966)-N(2))-methyltransferase RsmD [Spirochaetales bacterium]|nr:16S rRNA (guanine(966)-N(2))-methyltransferase RsmD [Spirochaetales bacterium]
MRVTGGIYGGRRITCPPGIIRPAMDRMRESVFAIVGDLSDKSFLDLFSGSGIVGIEAASRGASEVVFVENDRRKIEVLRSNTAFVTQETRIMCMPAERFLATNRRKFDMIFADPPFDYRKRRFILDVVDRKNTLEDGGSLLIHFPAEDQLPETAGRLIMYDQRKYGRSIVGFFTIG